MQFLRNLDIVDGACNFCHTVQLLLSFLLDGRDQPVMATVTTVIQMEKGVNTTQSRQFAAIQSPGI